MKPGLILLFILFFSGISAVNSQNKNGEVQMPDEFDYPYVTVSQVEVSGSKFTRDRIIIRELDLKVSDKQSNASLNLYNH